MYLKRIRDLREDNDISQEQIAKILQTTQETYHRYETGKRDIPLKHIIKLADFYNVSIDYLVGRK